MLSSIHQFSKSEEHESLAALVVFSHGKGGMIYGHDGVSKCSTQEVVNTFIQVKSQPFQVGVSVFHSHIRHFSYYSCPAAEEIFQPYTTELLIVLNLAMSFPGQRMR
ncbi:hypothetical protein EB796_007934 [Bugula neritina]|uniref:Caspase family p20 domain-containing protein n=1 Tax=Bugula neritina TaxID=10212 RepID=A0A7J7K539_BUGNE|nr:hypothetical protein EB796_007934 [Bugula neritina]